MIEALERDMWHDVILSKFDTCHDFMLECVSRMISREMTLHLINLRTLRQT